MKDANQTPTKNSKVLNLKTLNFKKIATKISLAALIVTQFSACALTQLNSGDASAKTEITGAAGGENNKNANSKLPRCTETLGTLGVEEDQGEPWFLQFTRDTRLTSTVPLIRLMVQQSNCFVIVERGSTGMKSLQRERALAQAGELRATSKIRKGQMVAADYTLIPTISFSDDTGGAMAGLGSNFGGGAGLVLGLLGSLSKKEASVTLTMIANRSGVQIAASEGSASKFDFAGMGGMFGSSLGGAFGGYTKTPEQKVLVGAFMDAYAQMVDAVKNYKAQTVQGGLGAGGKLKVDGE